MRNENKGFSLIEMLVSLVIIGMVVGVLVGILANPVKEAGDKSRIATVRDHYRAITDAEDFHYAMNEKWATKEELLASGALKAWPTPPDGTENKDDPDCLAIWGLAEYGYHVLLPPMIPSDKDYAILFPCPTEEFQDSYSTDGE